MVLNGNNATLRKYTLDTALPALREGSRRDPGASPLATSQGLDLSGTIHSAGGIGGLLAVEEETQGTYQGTYWFLYDGEPLTRRATRSVAAAGPRAKPARRVKGNGNLTQVLDATDTNSISIAAHYEYDPYGNVINNLSSYTYATANPFRFSTKWFDEETHLGYWGHRYYSPRLGRWMSRDPIEERGGWNLYAFVRNQLLNEFDPLGLCTCDDCKGGTREIPCEMSECFAFGWGKTEEECCEIMRCCPRCPVHADPPDPPPSPPSPTPRGCTPGSTKTGTFIVPNSMFRNCTDVSQTRTQVLEGNFQLTWVASKSE